MGTYAVAVSRTETTTIYVEANDHAEAERIALSDAGDNWESDTVNTQVDDIAELVGDAADKVASVLVKEEG